MKRHKIKHVHACLEATGIYSDGLAEFLHQAGYIVSVVNPAQIKAYADSRLSHNKTDKADATLLACYCRSEAPKPHTLGRRQHRNCAICEHCFINSMPHRCSHAQTLALGLRCAALRHAL